MEFITNLLFIGGYDSMFVIVDRFTKKTHFAPCVKIISKQDTTGLFLNNVVQLYGLTNNITYYQRTQFVPNFLWHLLQSCKTLSSTYYTQIDGQME
jgi:hypothetical protein